MGAHKASQKAAAMVDDLFTEEQGHRRTEPPPSTSRGHFLWKVPPGFSAQPSGQVPFPTFILLLFLRNRNRLLEITSQCINLAKETVNPSKNETLSHAF